MDRAGQAVQGILDLLRFSQHSQIVGKVPLQFDELAFVGRQIAQRLGPIPAESSLAAASAARWAIGFAPCACLAAR